MAMPPAKLTLDSPPEDFPKAWNAYEETGASEAIDELEELVYKLRSLDIDAVINKHVFLAVQQYANEAIHWAEMGEGGRPSIYVSIGEPFNELDDGESADIKVDVEKEFMSIEASDLDAEGFYRLAESFDRLAAHMRARAAMRLSSRDYV